MSKPSIFSKDYDKKMRNRKRLQIITIIVLIIGIFLVLTKAYVTNWLKVNAPKLSSQQNKYVNENGVSKKKVKSDEKKSTEDKEDKSQTPVENKSTVNAKLPDGKTVKIQCIDDGSIKKITSVSLENGDKVTYDINKDADKTVILDSKQNICIVDLTGKIKNVTKEEYVSTRGSIIKKDSYLSLKPDFIWHASPKFISNDKVAYITQMPWFRTTEYVYTVDIKTNNHVRIPVLQGNKISFGKLTKKGLETTIDGNLKYINAQGNLAT